MNVPNFTKQLNKKRTPNKFKVLFVGGHMNNFKNHVLLKLTGKPSTSIDEESFPLTFIICNNYFNSNIFLTDTNLSVLSS
jgi:hypothetical protein